MNDFNKAKPDQIPPNWENMIVCAVCGAAICTFIFTGTVKIRHTDLRFLLIIVIIGFLTQCKKYLFYPDKITIAFFFLPIRKISWDRVRNVEYLSWRGNKYILISLDDCSAFYQQGILDCSLYLLLHSRKLLYIRIPPKKETEYVTTLENTIRF